MPAKRFIGLQSHLLDGGVTPVFSTHMGTPREAGAEAGEACTQKAERVAGLNREAVTQLFLNRLRESPCTGEDLSDAALVAGHVPHDLRAFGPIVAAMARKNLIRCIGVRERRRGHGTAGARVWGLVL